MLEYHNRLQREWDNFSKGRSFSGIKIDLADLSRRGAIIPEYLELNWFRDRLRDLQTDVTAQEPTVYLSDNDEYEIGFYNGMVTVLNTMMPEGMTVPLINEKGKESAPQITINVNLPSIKEEDIGELLKAMEDIIAKKDSEYL